MTKKKYRRNKYSKNKRYYKKKRYTKKKIKKNLNKRGGSLSASAAQPSQVVPNSSSQSSQLSSQKGRVNNFNHINALDRIYGGNAIDLNNKLNHMPEFKHIQEIDDQIKQMMDREGSYQRVHEMKVEKMRLMEEIQSIVSPLLPKLLMLTAHGHKSKGLTLIPENKELYLTTGSGQAYYLSSNAAEKHDQVFGSSRYIRRYRGLIEDYYLDFNFIWNNDPTLENHIKYSESGLRVVQPRPCEGILDEKKFLTSITDNDLKTLKNNIWDNATNYPHLSGRRGKAKKEYLDKLLAKHNYNIIDRELMRIFILKSTRKTDEEKRFYLPHLSNILQIIENKSKELNLPDKILGIFCRSTGDLPKLNIDTFLDEEFQHSGLDPLTVEYFSDTLFYKSTTLTRQKSLASYHKIQNFWSIYHNVITNIGSLPEEIQENVSLVQMIIEMRSSTNYKNGSILYNLPDGIKLDVEDACLIFQCDYYLIKKTYEDYAEDMMSLQSQGLSYGGGK